MLAGCRITVHSGCSLFAFLLCSLPSPLQVSVLRLDAKGAVQRAPSVQIGAAGPPPSLTGAYLEVSDQGLAAGLPLQPGASLSSPVTVVVGKPPGSYDASTMQVRPSCG